MIYMIFLCIAGQPTCSAVEAPRYSLSGTALPGVAYQDKASCEAQAALYDIPGADFIKHRCFGKPTWTAAR